jgi:hypothetical protein
MLMMDVVWRALGRAHALRERRGTIPLVLLTSHAPKRPSEGDSAVRAAGPQAVFDVIDWTDPAALERLRLYAKGGVNSGPIAGFWKPHDLDRHLL